MTPPTWELMLASYTEEEREALEHAAEAQAERIEKAALDLSNTGVVDGINISELWFAVARRRQELAEGGEPVTPAEPEEPVEAPEAVGEAPEEPAEEDAPPAPEEVAEEAPEAEAPKPKRAPRKRTTE